MRRCLTAVLLLLAVTGFAQDLDVDEEELEELGTREVDFINYEGPYEQIDTIEEIVGIGRALGSSVDVDAGASDYTFQGKYRVIHAVDPDVEEKLDADIIVPLASARVDHINNLRRIISGFLQEAYLYDATDANLIARWVTIYNAVVRGNTEFFSDRYKTVVTDYLSPDNAGLSRRYDEWPGMSRIVIPLSAGAQPGDVGAVEPGELGDERVVEELRSQEDRGIEDRQDMADLTDRVIDEREQQIEDEEAAIAQEEARIAEEESAIEEERQAIDEDRETASDEEIADREAALDEREQQVQDDREQVEERRAEVADDRQEVAELTEQVRAEREQIARDARALLDEREISEEVRGLQGDLSPVYFLQVRDESGVILGQLVQINPVTGLLLNRSDEDEIVSRSYTFFGERLLVIVADGETGRLAEFDVTTLEEINRGQTEVFLASQLVVTGDPAVAYAVVREQGEWYLGRFDAELELELRSVIAVNPYTTMAFAAGKVWIQTSDDRIVALSTGDLRVAP